jgi:two-component system sensor histidine kinase VicK
LKTTVPSESSRVDEKEEHNEERTEVFNGSENLIDLAIQGYSRVKSQLDICADHTAPSLFLRVNPIWTAYTNLKSRGIKLRFITEITKENISSCKQIMRVADLRHLDGVKGNFGVDGIQYWAHASPTPGTKSLEQMVFSSVKALVEQQQYFFDTLWNKAIPAEQKIRQIEEGIAPDIIEVIHDPDKIQKLGSPDILSYLLL